MERLLNALITPNSSRIWILNRKYCPAKSMAEGKAIVKYSYNPVDYETPFSLNAIRDIGKYNYQTFVQAYRNERADLLDYDAREQRITAIWSFYKNVRKNDIILFVHGSEIEGYYIVTGDSVNIQNEEEYTIHSWEAETIRFKQPVCIVSKFGSPYFKLIGNFKNEVIAALTKSNNE